MGWFDEQLRYREKTDKIAFEDSIESIAGAVMGQRLNRALSEHEIAGSAIDQILKYYHCKPQNEEIPEQIKTVEEQLEYSMRPFGIMNREVRLDKGWYRNAVGAMLGTLKEDGSAVALIPSGFSGYRFLNIKTGEWTKVNSKTQDLLDSEAVCFYQALPLKSLTVKDLLKFMIEQLNASDIALYIALMGCSALLGLISPMLTRWLFSDVLQSGSVQVLAALATFMICFSISQLCFSAFQKLITSKIATKQNIAVEAAVMNRVMSLPTTFFRNYASGELTRRAAYVQALCSTLFNSIGVTGLTSVFSLIYIGQIFSFTPALAVPALLVMIITVAVSLITTFMQMSISRNVMKISAETSGMTYAMITGIQKIKLAGAEKRMFSRWAKQYAKEAVLEYDPPAFLKISRTITLSVSLIGSMILYAFAIRSRVSVADYYAFTTAYGMVSSAFMSFASIATVIADIKPTLEMAKPIMEAVPEMESDKERIVKLQGGIELSHVSFRYDESMPNVLDDLSLRIRPGEFLAIVGSTGCGKSTLMRLLLGFEKAQKGSIFYDNKDISRVDLQSLRKKIGVVMQDGKLFTGDIYSNIVIAAPQLTLVDAWEAAEIASLADDIQNMPMGMNTIIAEGQGGISGGQKQRLMIARAVAPKPRILMFDEATSALDNLTQRKVSEAIDRLKCTRIIIAHRLSTIQHADRIVYLDHGRIAEEGTYEQLIAKKGLFAELVARQRLDIENE